MDKFNRIYNLHKILSTSNYPVAKKSLEEKLACSEATVNQLITESRDYLDAPIGYD
jgi:biotin operon repressor